MAQAKHFLNLRYCDQCLQYSYCAYFSDSFKIDQWLCTSCYKSVSGKSVEPDPKISEAFKSIVEDLKVNTFKPVKFFGRKYD